MSVITKFSSHIILANLGFTSAKVQLIKFIQLNALDFVSIQNSMWSNI